jgi:hypothetical protein
VRKPVWAALRCTFMSQNRLQSLYSPVSKAEKRGNAARARYFLRTHLHAFRKFKNVGVRLEQGARAASVALSRRLILRRFASSRAYRACAPLQI